MSRKYIVTYDNPRNRDYSRAARLCGRVAHVWRTAPKTTLRLERRPGRMFRDILSAVASVLDARRGRALLVSRHTGNGFTMDNRGNRRGTWVKAS